MGEIRQPPCARLEETPGERFPHITDAASFQAGFFVAAALAELAWGLLGALARWLWARLGQ